MANPATFQEAFAAALANHGQSMWTTLSPSEQTRAIYQEMRRIDAERASIKIMKMPIAQARSQVMKGTARYAGSA